MQTFAALELSPISRPLLAVGLTVVVAAAALGGCRSSTRHHWCDDTGRNNRADAEFEGFTLASCVIPQVSITVRL